MSIWRSAFSTRVLVTLLALAAGVLAFYQAIALSDLDSEFPLAGAVGYAPLLLGVYGGAIALFFAWRPQQRQLGDMAGLFLALFALNLSLVGGSVAGRATLAAGRVLGHDALLRRGPALHDALPPGDLTARSAGPPGSWR